MLLRPGRYHFTGHLRTAGITSDEGIRFRALVAGGTNQIRGETPALSGTHDWTPLTMDFEVLSGMPVIDIEVARHRSLRLDNQLRGTAWVDAVRISRLP